MNALLASLLGFALGVGLVYVVVRYFSLFSFKYISAGHPQSAKIAGALAESSCWAHAGLLDAEGYIAAAEGLILASRGARRSPEVHLSPPEKLLRHLRAEYDQIIHQGNLSFVDEGQTAIHCEEHGSSIWGGDVRCARCMRTYGKPEGDDRPAPATCACGYRLLPEYRDERALPSSGSRVCRHCAAAENPEVLEVDPPDPDEQASLLFEEPAHEWGHCDSCEAVLYLSFGSVRRVLPPPPSVCPACGFAAETSDAGEETDAPTLPVAEGASTEPDQVTLSGQPDT